MNVASFFAALRKTDRFVLAVVLLWVLTMIATPIALWTFGQPGLYAFINAGVLVQVAASLIVLARSQGAKTALLSALAVPPLGWLAEFVGHTTGFPFSPYKYTDLLQPQLGGVPLLIPLAWLMMFPPAWAVAQVIVDGTPHSPRLGRLFRAAVAALAFTAWDLFLDPQMVAWDFWRWTTPGLYFGIPLVNFLGWLLVSFTISFLVMPRQMPVVPLVSMYVITWLLQTMGQVFFWNLPGPALFGFLGMGGMLAWAYARRVRKVNP